MPKSYATTWSSIGGGGDRAAVVERAPARLAPLVALGAGDARHEIEAVHLRRRAHALEHRLDLGDVRRDRAAHRALVAQHAGQRAGVDAVDAGDADLRRASRQRRLGAPARGDRRQLADREPGARDAPRLEVLAVDADVADLRRGHHDDLPAVRRIADDLLVAGDRRVEHDLADRLDARAEAVAAEDAAVLEDERGGPARGVVIATLPSRS